MHVFPDTESLAQGLSSIIGHPGGKLEIISREEFVRTSTFPVEIITCKQGENKPLRLFGKYLAGKGPNNYGHRGGVEYEALVYDQILSTTDLPTVRYYGKCSFPDADETLMVLEFLGEDMGLTNSEEEDVLSRAASWIGSFHVSREGTAPPFLTTYTRDYYATWAERFTGLTTEIRSQYAWLDSLLTYFVANLKILTDAPQTIIHGEYYPKNILLKDGLVYPVDWESAASAPGEIDLASLIEGWDEADASAAKRAYITTRWSAFGKQPDKAFEARLLLSKIYLYLWWWPDRIDRITWNEQSFRFRQALELAKAAAVYQTVNS